MQKISILIISLALLGGCKEKPVQQKAIPDTKIDTPIPGDVQDSVSSESSPGWADTAIIKYIEQTDNEIIKATRKRGFPVEWIFDRTENSDTAKYFVFQLGHSDEYKYITDSWLYVDSSTRAVYEYDIAKDSLIKGHQ